MTHLYDRHCNADVSNFTIYFLLLISLKLIMGEIRGELHIRDNLFSDNVDKEETVDGDG